MKHKVLIFIVCYHAEAFIKSVLNRIPKEIWNNREYATEVLIIDDQSTDNTFSAAADYAKTNPQLKLTVLANPKNLGYGGNQKIGYYYAIKYGFDVVVLLHGDGQYAPEYLPQMIAPVLSGEAKAVLGSRMIRKIDALKGRMPLYKWIGNQILTFCQNRLLKSRFAEFHTGYRAYDVATLSEIPFADNSDDFDFDTDILIQYLAKQKAIKEIPVPTFYGDELSRVQGFKYAFQVIRSSILYRLCRYGLLYHPKFDCEKGNLEYTSKFGYPSSHQIALDFVKKGAVVLDLGCGPGFMTKALEHKGARTIAIDVEIQPEVKEHAWRTIKADLNQYDFSGEFQDVEVILALDIVEHLAKPENMLRNIRNRFSRTSPSLLITTANIGFCITRLGLLLGQFNYGKRGILDLDHKRLFTRSSLRRLLVMCGFEIVKEINIPAPFPLALGRGKLAALLLGINRLLIFCSKGWFSYQIGFMAKPLPTLTHLLAAAQENEKHKMVIASKEDGIRNLEQ